MNRLPAMTEPRAYTVVRLTRVVSSFLIGLGIFGLLRTFAEDVSSDETVTVFRLVVHPISCTIYLVLGMVGVLAGTTAGRSQRFLGGLAVVMVLWALLGQLLRGTPDDAFSDATSVLLLHLGLALVAGGAVWLPERASAAPIAADDTTVPVEEIPAPAHLRMEDEIAPEGDRP
jgi:hypothetical protein